MNWYYSKDGAQHGPVTQEELQAKIRSGEVSASSLVWRDGMSDWTAANQLAEFATSQPVVATGVPAPYSPPASQMGAGYQAPIPNYLWQSIVVTLFCCLPFGIAAIVFASKVDTLRASGNIAEATEASRKAKMWCWWSFGLGLGFIVLYLMLVVFAGLMSNV